MDLGDLLSSLFQPTAPRRGASRLERTLGWIAFAGLILIVGFVWLAYSGF